MMIVGDLVWVGYFKFVWDLEVDFWYFFVWYDVFS